MTAASSTSKTELIFDALSDGIVFFGPTGAARFINQSARELFGPRVETLYTDERVQRALTNVRIGGAKLPLAVEIDFARAGQLVPIRATILDWKAGGGHTFVLAAGPAAPKQNFDLPATFELIRRELAEPLREVIGALQGARIDDPDLRARAAELVGRMEKLSSLSQAFGTDSVLTDERVQVREILEEAWNELAPLAEQRSVRVALARIDLALPPIYGSRRWLKRAATEMLHNAIVHGTAGRSAEDPALVEVSALIEGHWLAIEVANRGLGIRKLPAGRELLPFANVRKQLESGTPGLGVGLPLAQQIAELHGGHLDTMNDDGLARVTLRLPTGAPLGSGRDVDVEQAQRYAHDLAKLLARRTKQSA